MGCQRSSWEPRFASMLERLDGGNEKIERLYSGAVNVEVSLTFQIASGLDYLLPDHANRWAKKPERGILCASLSAGFPRNRK